jgi:hypothetical protein
MNTILVPDLLHLGIHLLPAPLQSTDAARLLAAIGWQESDWDARVQRKGPANGYFQFEPIGVEEVFRHPSSATLARNLLRALDYPDSLTPHAVYKLLEHNDLLAVGIARLALWRHPDPLPQDRALAWGYYHHLWRPGKPRPEDWARSWMKACALFPLPEGVLG